MPLPLGTLDIIFLRPLVFFMALIGPSPDFYGTKLGTGIQATPIYHTTTVFQL